MEYWKENINYRQEEGPAGIRFLITVDDQDIEVEESLYKAYTQMERRERYLAEREKDICISLDELSDDMDVFLQPEESTEDLLLARETAAEFAAWLRLLPKAMEQLTEDEQALIRALFFDGVPAREYARKTSVTLRAVQKRRDRILGKLKIILGNLAF